ncbi:MAG: hypothetical protein EOM64_05035 [Erysipelotrichia bacterium]|nr:hypothetical protein [Erysipelotrichia bacterium]
MAKYDYKYIRSLIRDIRIGDSDAFAAMFAATCQDQYHRIYARLQNEYDTQDVVQKTYSMILASDSIPSDPKTFLSVMNQYSDMLCQKVLETRSETASASDSDKAPDLNIADAETMLDYILHVNHWNQSSFTLETLTEYNSYRKSKSTLQRIILIIIMVCFCCIPLFFVKPDFRTELITGDNGRISYRITVSAILPIDRVTASMNGANLQVSKNADGTYAVYPADNGEMTVSVYLISMQFREETVTVTNVDAAMPTVTDKYLKDGMVHLMIMDEGSGIDYDSIYAVTDTGEKILPSSADEETGEITFPRPDGSYNIYISDKNGNQLHVILRITSGNG